MLTYTFEDRGKNSLYEYLYIQIKRDINNHKLVPQQKLPSKRALAKHLNISSITVENAYHQLVTEGYIFSIPKSGFYVSDISVDKHTMDNETGVMPEHRRKGTSNAGMESDDILPSQDAKVNESIVEPKHDATIVFADFVNNSTLTDNFPFATWTKLMRETMAENREKLMIKSPSIGVHQLRCAIVNHMFQFRGIVVEPEQIVVGAGTEYLYSLIVQLLGSDKKYAVEDPGYQKIACIYRANKAICVHIPLDENGLNMEVLEQSHADVLHLTPSHHFPTGLVTSINRRYELLDWASKSSDRYVIEDDYDSEFRLMGRPIPTLQSIDVAQKVIYINTFSKSLTSTIRISYMVLPKTLMQRYHNELSFYSCTVSNFEQYTLAKFIERGYLEKHINRMRSYYRNIRDCILANIKSQAGEKKIYVMEEHAGLHFLLKVDTELTDKELVASAAQHGIHISCLSQYYHDKSIVSVHILVINYSGVIAENIQEAIHRLFVSF